MDRFGNSYFSSCQTGLENIKLNGLVDDSLSENDFMNSKRERTSTCSKRLDFEEDSPCSTSVSDVSKKPFAKLFLSKGRKHQSDNHIHNQSQRSELFGTKSCVPPVLNRVTSTDSVTQQANQNSLKEILMAFQTSKEIQVDESLLKNHSSKLSPAKKEIEKLNESPQLVSHNSQEKLKDLGNAKRIESIEEDDQDSDSEDFKFEQSFARRLSISATKILKLPDFNTLSPQATAKLFYENHISDFLIVDCRYDYEYTGGHIKGALNITSPEVLEKIFFTQKSFLHNPKYIEDLKQNMSSTFSNIENYKTSLQDPLKSKMPMIIFHCEFSQLRGPRAYSAIRNQDRALNEKNYPYLDYPDIFVLDGGYRNFYKQFPELCKGGFVKMKDKNYKNELSQAQEIERINWEKRNFGKC